jgi:hypothetical protein
LLRTSLHPASAAVAATTTNPQNAPQTQITNCSRKTPIYNHPPCSGGSSSSEEVQATILCSRHMRSWKQTKTLQLCPFSMTLSLLFLLPSSLLQEHLCNIIIIIIISATTISLQYHHRHLCSNNSIMSAATASSESSDFSSATVTDNNNIILQQQQQQQPHVCSNSII